jgi:hypothetical protein
MKLLKTTQEYFGFNFNAVRVHVHEIVHLRREISK